MTKKYKIREDLKIEFLGRTLFRIEALTNIDRYKVEKGDLGGYIEKNNNLSQDGDAWVYGNAKVYGDAKVYGNAKVYGDAEVYGNAKVYGDAKVCGDKIEDNDDLYNITCNSMYNITITPNYIKIGCQFHKKEEWWNFTDREIEAMDGKKAIKFWKQWKLILMAICETKKEVKND